MRIGGIQREVLNEHLFVSGSLGWIRASAAHQIKERRAHSGGNALNLAQRNHEAAVRDGHRFFESLRAAAALELGEFRAQPAVRAGIVELGHLGGQKLPANSWAASVYIRDGDKWKGAFHAEAPVVDPKAAPTKPADKKEAPKKDEAKPAAPDASTDAMLVVEKAVWEAWKAHDAKKLEDLTARDISFINIFGTYFATKADALNDWTGAGCDVKSVSVTGAAGTMLSPTVGILTFKGAADGTCFGQKVGPIWGTSVYVKNGDAWKWTFGINLPAGR